MRLIDSDTVISELCDACTNFACDYPRFRDKKSIGCEFIKIINRQKESIRQGKWIYGMLENCNQYYCSECGNEAYWDTDYGQQLFDFCPRCGAKMRGAENGTD